MSKSRPVDRPPVSSNGADSTHADLNRVREILFGEVERQTAERLAQLEERTAQQAAALQELASSLRAEIGSVEQRLAGLLADASSGSEQSRDALREELLAEIGDLRENKLDRDALAGLLGGIADKLGSRREDKRGRNENDRGGKGVG